jgi:hypothetical protein
MTRRRPSPRLVGLTRSAWFQRLDPVVKSGLQAIARQERRSMASVVEEVIIRWFRLGHTPHLRDRLAPVKRRYRRVLPFKRKSAA